MAVSPRVYVERLTGAPVGRSGKVRCPFHEDRTPSLHVYEDPRRGWYCFGCGRGGSIYDFAGLLLGRGTRGEDFIELRRELARSSVDRPGAWGPVHRLADVEVKLDESAPFRRKRN